MDNPAAPAASLNVEQLLHLHTLTKDVAKVCQKQLRAYLDTLALLFRPRRILGDAIEGAERESVGGSERTLSELRDLYRRGFHKMHGASEILTEVPSAEVVDYRYLVVTNAVNVIFLEKQRGIVDEELS